MTDASNNGQLTTKLQNLHSGASQSIKLGNETLDLADCHKLANAIRNARSLTNFSSANTKFADFSVVSNALQSRRDLTHLTLDYVVKNSEDLHAFPNIIRNNPGIGELSLCGATGAPPELLEDLTGSLAALPKLHYLKFNYMNINNQAMSHLTSALAELPRVTVIDCSHNPIGDQPMEAIADLMRNRPNFLGLRLNSTSITQAGWNVICRAVLATPHPNLLHFSSNHSNLLVEPFLTHNLTATRRGVGVVKEGKIKPIDLWNVHERATAITNQGGLQYMQQLEKWLEHLPQFSPETAPSFEAAFTANEIGYTPIDNPKTWDAHPNLLEELAAQDGLTEEMLNRRTPHGQSLIEHALAYSADIRTVIQTLNDNDIRLQADALFQEDGSPSKLLEIVTERRQVAGLFTADNWLDASPRSVKTVLAKLPPDMRDLIPNKHGLINCLERQQQSKAMAI